MTYKIKKLLMLLSFVFINTMYFSKGIEVPYQVREVDGTEGILFMYSNNIRETL